MAAHACSEGGTIILLGFGGRLIFTHGEPATSPSRAAASNMVDRNE